MSLNNFAEYAAALQKRGAIDFTLTLGFATAARLGDLMKLTAPVPATPTTAVSLNRSSDCALNALYPDVGGALRCALLGARISVGGVAAGGLLLIDRLVHSGGLDATLTSGQTTGLPTAALPRYTDGVGVMIGLTIYTAIGVTQTTVSVSYTNTNDTPGRVTVPVTFGGTSFREINRLILCPLAAGDVGVKSVESVTVAASTTTAGNFGVTLFRPLAMIGFGNASGPQDIDAVAHGAMIGAGAQIIDGACLQMLAVMTTASIGMNGVLLIDGV